MQEPTKISLDVSQKTLGRETN